jgi:hypothetical protein
MNTAKNEKSLSAMLIQKTRAEVNGIDLLRFHFMMTYLMINVLAINNSPDTANTNLVESFRHKKGEGPPHRISIHKKST